MDSKVKVKTRNIFLSAEVEHIISENTQRERCIISCGFYLFCYPEKYVLAHTQFKYNWRVYLHNAVLGILASLYNSNKSDSNWISFSCASCTPRTLPAPFHCMHTHGLTIPIGKCEKCSLHHIEYYFHSTNDCFLAEHSNKKKYWHATPSSLQVPRELYPLYVYVRKVYEHTFTYACVCNISREKKRSQSSM